MSIKLWGGIECTVNRVGDAYFDQIERTGHASRVADLDLLADLGIKTVRYPVLWERTDPRNGSTGGTGGLNWQWAEERLIRLRQLDIDPIVGLLHHGSGPRYTSLIDPYFPELFSEYARQVAERFPWVENYTPINEPLTTARFSGLYGLWYPHFRSDAAFARAFIQQCGATVLAMRKIRQVNTAARLIQTEDLGKTFSTPALEYQARFENERRWLTYDVLCGKVGPNHKLWKYFLRAGITQCELHWFQDNVCPPDIIGINHYVTSERYLDEDIKRYPRHTHGGNRRHRYVDVEAVRVNVAEATGPDARIQETWERYGLPIAITEAHLSCTSDERVRWFHHVWRAAENQRRTGADIRAVTAWALLGAFDWDCLLTRDNDHYEPGVFDVRTGHPQPTALAETLRQLTHGQPVIHRSLLEPGWWLRPERVLYPMRTREAELAPEVAPDLTCQLCEATNVIATQKESGNYRTDPTGYTLVTSPHSIQNP